MKKFLSYLILNLLFTFYALAGDYAGGKSLYSVDLSEPFITYKMTKKDKKWVSSLVKNLKYRGKTVHFVRTSLLLKVEDSVIKDSIYQAIEKPDYFYVLVGDAMMKIGTEFTYSPRVGGFSTHMKKSKDFIVCLNFQRGGVPFVGSSKVIKGLVSWRGWELPSAPLVKVKQSVKKVFPKKTEEELKDMFTNGLWNEEKSAVFIAPSHLFTANKVIVFDIAKAEKVNLGTIGSH